jgi:hypothetical protein
MPIKDLARPATPAAVSAAQNEVVADARSVNMAIGARLGGELAQQVFCRDAHDTGAVQAFDVEA